MFSRHAADLLFVAGWPPMFGIFGQWIPSETKPLMASEIAAWLRSILAPAQWDTLAEKYDLDFALSLPTDTATHERGANSHNSQLTTHSSARFRINAHYQKGGLAAAIRAVPHRVPCLEELGLPAEVARLAEFPHGLVLVTGGTGHGKSTTLASLIARLNDTRACHIITLEDPVEFEFPRGLAMIEQREIGRDSPSFAHALRHVVRQRPDVILIGEMRDWETMSIALTAAETGHLVLASLHTCNTAQALARIIDVFPPVQQPQVRTQLAASLRAIVGQVLLPVARSHDSRITTHDSPRGLVPAMELLFANDAVRRAIRDNETHLIYGMIETGRQAGMSTLEQSLAALVTEGRVEPEAARAVASYPDRLDRLLRPRV